MFERIGENANDSQASYLVCILFSIVLLASVGCGKDSPSNQHRPETHRNANQEKQVTQMGTEMVLIPAGEFQMGSHDGAPDEQPVHSVYVDAFYIDKHEVTVGQYRQFVDAAGVAFPDWTEVAQCRRYSES